MTKIKKMIAAGVAFTSVLAFTNTASAATIYGEIKADAGTYAPIALGDNLLLDGCGSFFDDNPDDKVLGNTVSLCNGITDLSPFDFTWTIEDDFGTWGYVYGIQPIVTTGGAADIIQTAGTYYLSLNITLSPSSSTFALPGGDTGAFQPNQDNRDPNSDSFFDVALIVTPASVPEPAGALLLLPAMVYMARRQRKRRAHAAS